MQHAAHLLATSSNFPTMGCLRIVAAIPLGLVAMGVTVALCESISHVAFPTSDEMRAAIETLMKDPQSTAARDAVLAAIPTAPTMSFLSLVIGWALGAAVGAFVAVRVAGAFRLGFAFCMALLATATVGINLFLIPHPSWMPLVAIASTFGAALLAGLLGSKRPAPSKAA